MEPTYIKKIAEKLSFSLKQVNNIFDLQAEGATIPFMARYRKEATGNMDEVQINDVVELIKYFTELDKRKETVLKTIEGLGKLTPELKRRIDDCYDATILEDIYLPYKQKRKTKAETAREAGLGPLAEWLWACGHGGDAVGETPEARAAAFVDAGGFRHRGIRRGDASHGNRRATRRGGGLRRWSLEDRARYGHCGST